MSYELAKAHVTVRAATGKLSGDLAKTEKQFKGSVDRLSSMASKFGVALGAGAIISQLRTIANESTRLAAIQMEAEQRLSAVLRATGFTAGFTSDQLKRFASDLQSVTTIGDEAILGTMAKLATFRSVSGRTFKEATRLSLDLAAVGFGSADSAAIMLGKALEDPIRGLTALRRVGVSFSEQQEDQIKLLATQNRLFEAQTAILAGVAQQVEGTAKAMAKLPSGQLLQIENQIGDLKEQLGEAWLPTKVQFAQSKKSFWEHALWLGRVRKHFGYAGILGFTDRTGELPPGSLEGLPAPEGLRESLRARVEHREKQTNAVLLGIAKTKAGTLTKDIGQGISNLAQFGKDIAPKMSFVAQAMQGRAEGEEQIQRFRTAFMTQAIKSFLPALRFGVKSAIPDFQMFGRSKTPEHEVRRWGRFMGFEEVNRTMQQAFLEEKSTAEVSRETNRILTKLGTTYFGAMKGSLNSIAAGLKKGVSGATQTISVAWER
jgi:hypothetical protein